MDDGVEQLSKMISPTANNQQKHEQNTLSLIDMGKKHICLF